MSDDKIINKTMDWDLRYRENDTPWEEGEAAPPLVEFLEKNSVHGKVLVPGCGFGHDVRLLASQGAIAIGMDISKFAIEKAHSFLKLNNEDYILADYFASPKNLSNEFDWVFEHTCFCAIDPSQRDKYISSTHKILKNNGKLLAIFFTHTENNGKPPHQIESNEIDILFKSKFKTLKIITPNKFHEGRKGNEQLRLMEKI